jgi:UDP-N-acetylmuramoylalanine--D-glutamate ligase
MKAFSLSGKTVVVVGLGKSGVSAARLCSSRGAKVIANDAAPLDRLSPEARALAGESGVTVMAGGHENVPFREADLVVVSPGVPPLPVYAELDARGIPVVGELDLAWQLVADVPTAAIGGTNGKSTTTSLVADMLEAAGKRTFAGGNLGTPLSDIAIERKEGAPSAYDALVLEVSSFQAERMPTFHPRAATLLNITPDHLDRYPSLQAYADAKGNMLAHMGADDVVVIPHGDNDCLQQARRSRARIVTFGHEGDVRYTADRIVDSVHGTSYLRGAIKLTGNHNALNVCASIALASALGASADAIATSLGRFEGLSHRIAFAGEIEGVRYYDDSKGTNVGASVAALRGLSEAKAVLIAGGRDKLGSYEPLVEALVERGRGVVLIGEAAPRIAEALGARVPHVIAATMEDAVEKAAAMAQRGDAVLLSPACSSFDMFRDYKHRGDVFVAAVTALAERRGA